MIKKTAALIIENSEGKVLLMLRDNKPDILYPDYWALIGGFVEKGESLKEAIVREAKEELGCNIKNFNFFKRYVSEEKEDNFYYVMGDYRLKDFKLGEGQEIRFFSEKEISDLKIMPKIKKILLDYFENHS